MIFDNAGDLIWYGNDTIRQRSQDLHVCDYNDHGIGTHLCYNDALPVAQGGHSSGTIRFFDSSYSELGNDFGGVNGLGGPDIHELNTPDFGDGSSFIQEAYQSVVRDLSAYDGPVDGYVWDSCFQVVNFDSREAIFQWCTLDHIDLNETYAYMAQTRGQYHNEISGNGTEQGPWDYAHINAIDLTPTGDYLVSIRHTHSVVKVAGLHSRSGLAAGSVIWRLGGKLSNFALENFQFAWQHHVRSQLGSLTTDDLTLFDNSGDGSSQTANFSTGKWIHVDARSMAASMLHEYKMPDGAIAYSQGSMQTLPNQNVLVGWGSSPYVTEFDVEGNVLTHIHFGLPSNNNMQNYRAWKHSWVAHPPGKPTVFAYAQNCTSDLHAYVSWNGATEVTGYRFHKGDDPTGNTDLETLIKPRSGFETAANLGTFAPYAFVEALDKNGKVLGTSATTAAFVPNPAVASTCNQYACEAGFTYGSPNAQSCNSILDLNQIMQIPTGPAPLFDMGK